MDSSPARNVRMQTVGDIMSHPVKTVKMDHSLYTLKRIFEDSGFHHLVVKDGGKPVGVINIHDLNKHLSPFIGNTMMERQQDRNTLKKLAHQLMHREIVSVHEDVSLFEAADVLLKNRVTCLPVIDREGHLRGIVTWRDLLPLCFRCEPEQSDAA